MSFYKSEYTGEQIDRAVGDATEVVANNGEGTTADLSTLKVGDVNYKIPEPIEPTEVVANNGEGTTADLSTLKVGDVNYKVPEIDDTNYLTLPDTTPDSPRIVSIAVDGTQQDLTLGDGLTVENGVISASGGAIYRHNIFITARGGTLALFRCSLSIFNNDPTPINSVESLVANIPNTPARIMATGGGYSIDASNVIKDVRVSALNAALSSMLMFEALQYIYRPTSGGGHIIEVFDTYSIDVSTAYISNVIDAVTAI